MILKTLLFITIYGIIKIKSSSLHIPISLSNNFKKGTSLLMLPFYNVKIRLDTNYMKVVIQLVFLEKSFTILVFRTIKSWCKI